MENPDYEKDSLTGPPVHAPPTGPPLYGAVNMPGSQSLPPYFPGGAQGYVMPPSGGYPPMNPRYQGYSPLTNEDSRVDVVAHTTILVPAIIPSPPDYMCYSIFNLLCCCLPLGIVALVFSLRTQECNVRGDVIGARQNSETALTFNRVALGVGFIICIVYVLCVIFLVIIPQMNKHSFTPFNFGG